MTSYLDTFKRGEKMNTLKKIILLILALNYTSCANKNIKPELVGVKIICDVDHEKYLISIDFIKKKARVVEAKDLKNELNALLIAADENFIAISFYPQKANLRILEFNSANKISNNININVKQHIILKANESDFSNPELIFEGTCQSKLFF